ncbi:NAD(P)/FAD-dependent oxidoreductase [Isachenkonia alkalipeptolytica]|uniref:FAD-dependent oxidoreductase n=1 Tax=Isachenkonia alkalipeptolytica TaxID=2565777 RepID=A0AA44BF13_9CLOT|nr:NAD(P)/FAD-dependent oxidoreductase [Isachenkonia alkalipeptolytica]NBG88740.1 FAD-dependent oxidoreductase [Isachenkonia alkalipeptolytica]
MIRRDILVIGGGPSGLCAAIAAAKSGATVLLVERSKYLGGQLVKQTHMFFGSEKQYASKRGIDIGKTLAEEVTSHENIKILTDTTALGIYEDGVVTLEQRKNQEEIYIKVRPKSIIVGTGALEKSLPFPNNDLPGIYGAGAVQTLMNEYLVKPGNRVLMVGAGNIGLIISYQLLQAGVEVAGIIDASSNIGGYLVHASKIRRSGVPILTGYTIVKAEGENHLEKATIAKVDQNWKPIPGTEKEMDVDVICISVGLTPSSAFFWQGGCDMEYVRELGGYVPKRNKYLQTTVENIYVAGDSAGIEEASSAMVEGSIAGLAASHDLGLVYEAYDQEMEELLQELQALRGGEKGGHVRKGYEKAGL